MTAKRFDEPWYTFKDGANGFGVVTLAVWDDMAVRRKNLRFFCEVSRRLPDVQFNVLGPLRCRRAERLKTDYPEVGFLGFLPKDILDQVLELSSVYVQLSDYEAFGLALAEAMAKECVPVVGGKGAFDEVVGDTGYIVPLRDLDATVQAVRRALTDRDRRVQARLRVYREFSLRRRERSLQSIIGQIWDQETGGSR